LREEERLPQASREVTLRRRETLEPSPGGKFQKRGKGTFPKRRRVREDNRACGASSTGCCQGRGAFKGRSDGRCGGCHTGATTSVESIPVGSQTFGASHRPREKKGGPGYCCVQVKGTTKRRVDGREAPDRVGFRQENLGGGVPVIRHRGKTLNASRRNNSFPVKL